MRFRPSAVLIAALAIPVVAVVSSWASTDDSAPDDGAPVTDFTTLRSPVPPTDGSIKRGRDLYLRYCTDCHGLDGKALAVTIASATDLTDPEMWLSGTAEGEVYRSIRDGAGVDMPGFSFYISDGRDIWHLVNYTISLWPEEKRPPEKERQPGPEGKDHGKEGNS